MANIKSAKKRVLVTKTKSLNNKSQSSALKTAVKKANASEGNAETIRFAIKCVDKAAAKGIMHKNTAARKKSALMKKISAAQ